jgi:23S rRNA pseudouridine1911/1915/1917 synthase
MPQVSMPNYFEIVYEDHGLLVVNKPAGLVCHPTKPDGHSSLISRVRQYLEPGSEPHMMNRLDRETSGLVLIAKHRAAEREVRCLWEHGCVRKEYLAIVYGHVPVDFGTIDAPLGRDEQSKVAIKDKVRQDGYAACTRFKLERRLVQAGQRYSLLRIWPATGRKHQIRIHFAHLGYPVVGDKLYAGDEDCYLAFTENCLSEYQRARLVLPFHALHAYSIRLKWARELRRFMAAPESWFASFLAGSTLVLKAGNGIEKPG